MTNSLVVQIDMLPIREDGLIEIFERPFTLGEYPTLFQYKLYLPFEENEKKILRIIFGGKKVDFEYSERLGKYLENRKALYEEVCKKYFGIISSIENSILSPLVKRRLIQTIDSDLNQVYPYTE